MIRFLVVVLVICAVIVVAVQSDDTLTVTIADHTFHVEVADTLAAQAHGLAGRDALAGDEAMLFVFHDAVERTFWMKGVRFPIDIIWLRDNTIIGIAHDVQPEPGVSDDELTRYRSPGPVNAVLEVVAGTAEILHIGKGDVMIY